MSKFLRELLTERGMVFSEGEGGGAAGSEAAEGGTTSADAAETSVADADAGDSSSETTNWRDMVTDPDLRKVADRFNTPTDAVKALADARRHLSTAIRIPGKDATAEERATFHKALGVPDAPEGYKFGSVEGQEFTEVDLAYQQTMAKAMHKAGIPATAAEQLITQHNEFMKAQFDAQIEADKKFAEEASQTLQREWGKDYERNLEFAKRAAREVFADDFENLTKLELKDGRFLLDHPSIIKAMSNIGSEMAEGTIGPRLDANEVSSLNERINELGEQKMNALSEGDRTLAARLDKEQRELIGRVSTNGPIVGSGGRAY